MKLAKIRAAEKAKRATAALRTRRAKEQMSALVAVPAGGVGGALAALVDSQIDDPELGGTKATVGTGVVTVGGALLGFFLRKSPIARSAAYGAAAGSAGAMGYGITADAMKSEG